MKKYAQYGNEVIKLMREGSDLGNNHSQQTVLLLFSILNIHDMKPHKKLDF